MAINVAADLATLLGATGEFTDPFTLWPDTDNEAVVRGILHSGVASANRGQTELLDEQVKAIFPTAAVVGLKANDELTGPAALGSSTQALYRVLELRPTPYAVTEVLLRETE